MSVISVSAPGSLMIAGEHAVCYGGDAIATAIDKRLTVTVSRRSDQAVSIRSDLGQSQHDLSHLPKSGLHKLVHQVIKQSKLTDGSNGINIKIQSEINPKLGLGSSAALLTATYHAITRLQGKPLSKQALFEQCLAIVHQSQPRASGTDLQASIHGGVIHFSPTAKTITKMITKMKGDLPIQVIFSGSKTPTSDVINRIATHPHSDLIQSCLDNISRCVPECYAAIQAQDWQKLGDHFHQHQHWLTAMGLTNEPIEIILSHCQQAKISGSGLGDCIIALDHDLPQFPFTEKQAQLGIKSLAITTSQIGLTDEVPKYSESHYEY